MSNHYRCGWCGHPTNEKGEPLTEADQKLWVEAEAELVHGMCCIQEQYEPQYVTRDMALDAGDPSLEGQLY